MTGGAAPASGAGAAPAVSGTPTFRLVEIAGDGVGPEVMRAARRALDAVAQADGFRVEWREVLAGGRAIDEYGVAFRDEDLATVRDSDAVLLGAVGGPKWSDPTAPVRPEQALLALRSGLGLFANLRPIVVHPALVPSSPLRPELLGNVDMLIVRELTGGLYFGQPSGERTRPDGQREAVDTLAYSEPEIRRVVRLAFELARARRGKLTSVDKANILSTSRLWRKVVDEEKASFADVTVSHQLVDSCAMLLIRQPSAFDVLVMENMFGDILSDEAAVFAGSLGMLPSASLGDRMTAHGRFGLYEPIHGSAPDIAGKGIANPLGTILSVAMMLRWSLGRPAAADALERAVSAAIDHGHRTGDLLPLTGAAAGISVVGTDGMTDAVIERIAR